MSMLASKYHKRHTRVEWRRTLGPQLNGSQGLAEHLDIRDKTEDLVGDTRAADTAKTSIIDALEEVVVTQAEVVWDGRELEFGKEQVDLDAAELHLDDGNKGLWNTLRKKETIERQSARTEGKELRNTHEALRRSCPDAACLQRC